MIEVTAARTDDLVEIAALLEELGRFYGDTYFDPIEARTMQIGELLFGFPPVAHVLMARIDGMPVGLAAFSYLWPAAGITASLYLKELYVIAGHRRAGVGRALMGRLIEIATARGCSRLEWTTDRDNSLAQMFYSSLGFEALPKKVLYRLPIEGV